MSADLFDSITRIARHEAAARAVAAVGRVTVAFPADGVPPDHAVTVELRDTGLVLPRVPIAVGVLGAAAIPAVDDLVVVVFLEGDVNAPVVVGRLYHADHDPPEHTDGEIVLRLPPNTANPGFNLVVSTEAPKATLDLPGDVHVEVSDGKVLAEVGDLRLALDASGGGRAELAAGGTKVTAKMNGDIVLKCGTKISLEAPQIEINGSGRVKITGGLVEVN